MPRERYLVTPSRNPACLLDRSFTQSQSASIERASIERRPTGSTRPSPLPLSSLFVNLASDSNARVPRMEDNQVHQQHKPSKAFDGDIEFISNSSTSKPQSVNQTRKQQDVKKPSKLAGKGPLAEKVTSSPFFTGRNTLNGKPAEPPRAQRNAAAGPSSEPRPLRQSKQATDNERVIRSRRTLHSDDDRPPAVPGRHPTAGDDLAQWPYPAAGTIRPGLPQHPAKAESKSVGFGSHGRASGVNGIARGRRSTVSPTKPDDRPARMLGPEFQETSDPESEPIESIDAFPPRDVGSRLFDTGTSSSGQVDPHAGVFQKPRQPMRRKDGSLPESSRSFNLRPAVSSHIKSSFYEHRAKVLEAYLDNAPLRVEYVIVRPEVVALMSGTQTVELSYAQISKASVCCVPEHPRVLLQAATGNYKSWDELSRWDASGGTAGRSGSKLMLDLHSSQATASALELFRLSSAKHGRPCHDISDCEKKRSRVGGPNRSKLNVDPFDSSEAQSSALNSFKTPTLDRTDTIHQVDAGPSRLNLPVRKRASMEGGQQTLSLRVSPLPKRRMLTNSPSGSAVATRKSARHSYVKDSLPKPDSPLAMPENRNEELFVFPLDDPAGLSITRGDRWRIEAHEFLNDTLIDFGLKHAIASLPPAVQERVHLFNSFFYEKLSSKGKNRRIDDSWPAYDSVRKWTKGKNLFEKDFILVPINENFHWYLAIIYMPKRVLGARETSDVLQDERQSPQRPVTRSIMASEILADTPEQEATDPIRPDEALSTTSATEVEVAMDRLLSDEDMPASSTGAADRSSPCASRRSAFRRLPDPINLTEQDSETEETQSIGEVNGEIQRRFEAVSVSSEGETPQAGRPIETGVLSAISAQQETTQSRFSEAPEQSPEKEPPKHRRDLVEGEVAWILTFDSLGGSHKAVHSCLDAWLRFEARDKLGASAVEYKTPSQYLEARVPLQPNSSDCGLYLVHFANQILKHTSTVLAFLESPVPRRSGDERKEWETLQNDAWSTADTGSMRALWLGLLDSLTHEHRNKKLKIFKDTKNTAASSSSVPPSPLEPDSAPSDTLSLVPIPFPSQGHAMPAARTTNTDTVPATRTPPTSSRSPSRGQAANELSRSSADRSDRRASPQPSPTPLDQAVDKATHTAATMMPADSPLSPPPVVQGSSSHATQDDSLGDDADPNRAQTKPGSSDLTAVDPSLSAIRFGDESQLTTQTQGVFSVISSEISHDDFEMQSSHTGAAHLPDSISSPGVGPEAVTHAEASASRDNETPYTHTAPLRRLPTQSSIELSPLRSLGTRQQNGKSSPRETGLGIGLGNLPSSELLIAQSAAASASRARSTLEEQLSDDEHQLMEIEKREAPQPSSSSDGMHAEKIQALSRVIHSQLGFSSPANADDETDGPENRNPANEEPNYTRSGAETLPDDLASINSEVVQRESSTPEATEPIESMSSAPHDDMLPTEGGTTINPAESTRSPSTNAPGLKKGRGETRKRRAPKSGSTANGKKARKGAVQQTGSGARRKLVWPVNGSGGTRESAIDVDSDEGD